MECDDGEPLAKTLIPEPNGSHRWQQKWGSKLKRAKKEHTLANDTSSCGIGSRVSLRFDFIPTVLLSLHKNSILLEEKKKTFAFLCPPFLSIPLSLLILNPCAKNVPKPIHIPLSFAWAPITTNDGHYTELLLCSSGVREIHLEAAKPSTRYDESAPKWMLIEHGRTRGQGQNGNTHSAATNRCCPTSCARMEIHFDSRFHHLISLMHLAINGNTTLVCHYFACSTLILKSWQFCVWFCMECFISFHFISFINTITVIKFLRLV